MPGYVALPAYRPQGAINFDPLNQGIDDLSKEFEKNRLLRQAQAVGAALIPGTTTPAITAPTAQNPLMAQPSYTAQPSPGAQANTTNAIDFLKQQEGYAPVAQWDVRQNSGGYGSKAAPGEQFTPAKAEQYLRRDVAPVENWLNTNAPNLTAGQRTALTSFGYNLGVDDLERLKPDIQAGNWARLSDRMKSFNKSENASGQLEVNPGLVNRRGREAALVLPPPPYQDASAPAAATPAPGLSQGIDYLAGARAAAKQGNVALAVQLLEKQQELGKSLREEQTFNDTHQKAVATRVGNLANAIAQEPDKAKQASMWQRMVAMDPEIAHGLQQNGIDPNDVESGTRFMINQARGITEKLGKDRYVVAGKRVFDTATQQFISSPDGTTGDDEKYAKQITYGLDQNGDPVAMQAGDNATLAASKLPPGIKIAGKDPIRLNGGDRWILLDPVTRAKIGEIPINVAAEAAAKEEGKSQVERQNAKPQAQLTAETAISGLDRIKQEIVTLKGMPSLSSATGNLQSRLPNVWQSTADADSSIRNLKNKLATTALQAMRDASKTGGAVGSVTEREWPILESMIGNLDPSQGDATFVTRLGEIENYLEGAKARISGAYQQTYGEQPAAPSAAPANAAGDVKQMSDDALRKALGL